LPCAVIPPISEPSKVQRKTEEAAALFTTSWTKTRRPNQG
jgi:hypothetical protein